MVDDRQVRVVVDNVWIRPDGLIVRSVPSALAVASHAPGWMLRAEGWALVSCVLDTITVQFDPRRIGSRTLQGILDALRALNPRDDIRRIDIRYFAVDEAVVCEAGSTLAASRCILQIYEASQELENSRYALFQQKTRSVETTILDVASPVSRSLMIPRMLALMDIWQQTRSFDELIHRLGAACQHVSVFRLEDGDPRVCQLGGSLMFTVPDSEGARLADIIPAAQVPASRERIVTTILSGMPALNHHRSETYDILSLSVPAQAASRAVAISMTQHLQESPFQLFDAPSVFPADGVPYGREQEPEYPPPAIQGSQRRSLEGVN